MWMPRGGGCSGRGDEINNRKATIEAALHCTSVHRIQRSTHLGHVGRRDALAHALEHQGGRDGGVERAHAVQDGVGAGQLRQHAWVGSGRDLMLVGVTLCVSGDGGSTVVAAEPSGCGV